jgi:hypothetical protein
MGIEPTWERLHAPTPDLKSGSPTSELGASERQYIVLQKVWQSYFLADGRLRIGNSRMP